MKKMRLMTSTSILCLVSALLLGCNNRHMPAELQGDSGPKAGGERSNELTYEGAIKPIFEKCLSCHGAGNALGDWTKYETIIAKKDRIYDRVVVKKNMPPSSAPIKLTDSERGLIDRWIKAGAPEGEKLSHSEPLPPGEISPPGDAPPVEPQPPLEPPMGPPPPETFVAKCSACHGVDGLSQSDIVPNLAGQNPEYLKAQIDNFRSQDPARRRADLTMQVMEGIAAGLTDDEVQIVSSYYAGLTTSPEKKEFTPEQQNLISAGRVLAEQFCINCHKPDGRPGAFVLAPSLNGQRQAYLLNQLTALKSGARPNAIMNGILSAKDENQKEVFTLDKLEALSYYFHSLDVPTQKNRE